MQVYVSSGYTNLYRPPYSLTNENKRTSTIYCVSSAYSEFLIIIPLVPGFYKDLITFAHQNSSRDIIIVAQDIGVTFISDYYLCWDYITHRLNKKCTIISAYRPENKCPGEFIEDIIIPKNDTITYDIPRSNIDLVSVTITFTEKKRLAGSPFATDIILQDTLKKILFVSEMNENKAKYLNDNKKLYDEIHMAFITSNYGGMTYGQLMKSYPSLVSKVVCNQFASYEELMYAKMHSIPIGRRYTS